MSLRRRLIIVFCYHSLVYFDSNTMPTNYTETDEWREFVWEFLEDSKKAGIDNMISDWELKPFVCLRLTTISVYVSAMIEGRVTRQLGRRTGLTNVMYANRLKELVEGPASEEECLNSLLDSLIADCDTILNNPRVWKEVWDERNQYEESLGSKYEYDEKSFWRFK